MPPRKYPRDIEETARLLMKEYGYTREMAIRQAIRWS